MVLGMVSCDNIYFSICRSDVTIIKSGNRVLIDIDCLLIVDRQSIVDASLINYKRLIYNSIQSECYCPMRLS